MSKPNQTFTLDEILSFFHQINPGKSQSTYTTMKYNLQRISKVANIDFIDIDATTIQPTTFLLKMEKYSLNTKIQTILGIELWIKYKIAKIPHGSKTKIEKYNQLKFKWDRLLKEMCNSKTEQINKNEMTTKEKENWIDYDELRDKIVNHAWSNFKKINETDDVAIHAETIKENYVKWRDLTLVGLFTLIPPTRIGNYQKMKIRFKRKNSITSYKQDKNYLMIDEGTEKVFPTNKYILCFNQYKTSKFVGQVSKPITDHTLIKLLDRYLLYRLAFLPIKPNKLVETDTLFLTADTKKPLTQAYITETLKKTTNNLVGKKLSCDMFRKIFLTWFLSDNSKSIAERQEMAKFIGQTYTPAIMEKYKRIKQNMPKTTITLNFD